MSFTKRTFTEWFRDLAMKQRLVLIYGGKFEGTLTQTKVAFYC